jgi:hypothetical protein
MLIGQIILRSTRNFSPCALLFGDYFQTTTELRKFCCVLFVVCRGDNSKPLPRNIFWQYPELEDAELDFVFLFPSFIHFSNGCIGANRLVNVLRCMMGGWNEFRAESAILLHDFLRTAREKR